MRQKTTIVAAAAAVLGLSLALTGCRVGFGPQEQATQSYDVTDKVAALEIRTGSGEVVVGETDRQGVHVTETLRWNGERPSDGHRVDGDTLKLVYSCVNCVHSVDYRVDIPRGLAVRIDTGSGEITLRDLTGRVTASTGSGEIDARGLAGDQVSANTGSGDVKLRFGKAPQRVTVQTGSGDGQVWVPDGTYNVTTQTGSGEQKVEVAQDPSAPHTIVVKTGSGDAVVHKQ
ncbi:DUF4097 family beta strand repeat-containing protein [Sphaerimonospora thailandensis]|uniref:DUF4097 domain-containing protein n=1 Tax=Sphaerimonospora thailandensis TaxID=795644 RepID=A0A8J3R536_9ACTN|nr:DUF4097 family beta strand repeat-containing protein [Sphaerimonospora thailandensis]GIH68663.1 hypothetical protein Mth01_09160 [Sphaerimonospora thailandensis]